MRKKQSIYVGSHLVPWRSECRYFASICDQPLFSATYDEASDWSGIHNCYVIYCVALLMAATGHRPVTDPFHSIDSFDLERGLLLIDDKEIFPVRGPRLVWLAPMAIEVMRKYLMHLDAVSRKFGWKEGQLAMDIRTLCDPGTNQRMPLFFFLEKNAKQKYRWKSVTPGDLKQRIRGWIFPLNTNRHLLAQELRGTECLAYQVEALLGHMEAGFDIFSIESVVDAGFVGSSVRPALEKYLGAMGWQVWDGLLPKKGAPRPKHQKGHLIEPPLFGPSLRKVKRETAWTAISKEVDKIVESRFPRGISGDIADEEIDSLRKSVLEMTRDKGEGTLIALSLLRRKLSRIRRGGIKIKLPGYLILEKTNSSPFDGDSLYLSSLLEKAQCVFERYLAQGTAIVCETRIAEIVLAAVLWGGVTDQNIIDALPEALLSGIRLTGKVCSVEMLIPAGKNINRQVRWLPDAISLALITGLVKNLPIAGGQVDRERVFAELYRLMCALGFQKRERKKSGVPPLAVMLKPVLNWARAYWRVKLPGVLRHNVEGEFYSAPLEYSRWAKVMSGEQVASDNPIESTLVSSSDSVGRLPPTASASNCWAHGKEFWKQLTKALSVTDGRSSFRKAQLVESIQGCRTTSGAIMPATGDLLCQWLLHLCEHGTLTQKTLKASTVITYGRTIGRGLLEYGSRLDLLALQDTGFEDLYFRIVDEAARQQESYLVGRLQEFHRYLVDVFGVPRIDWSEVSDCGDTGAIIDAGVVTTDEYQQAFELLRQDTVYDERGRLANAMVLLMGFCFGLRRGEIFRLRVSDLLHNERHTVVLVRNSTYGETKTDNGVRQIPLIGTLSSLEQDTLSRWLAHVKYAAENHNTLLFCSQDDPRRPIDVVDTVSRVVEALRLATGDPNTRLRHLRHSFASRLFLSMLPQQDCSLIQHLHSRMWGGLPPEKVREILLGRNELSPRALYGVAMVMGHGDIKTTLSHYIHFLDVALRGWHDANPASINDKALAYAYGVTYSNMRQLRSRKGNLLGGDMLEELRRQLNRISPSEGNIIRETPGVLALPVRDRSVHRLRMSDTDRLISLFGIRSSLDGLADRFLLNDTQVMLLREIASRLQEETGFSSFALPVSSRVFWIQPSTQRNAGIDKEAKRSRKCLGQLESIQSTQESTLVSLADLWKEAFEPGSRILLLSGPQALDKFIKTVAVLDLSQDDFVITVPPFNGKQGADVQDEVAGMLRHQGLRVRQQSLPLRRSRFAPESRVAITLKSGRSEMGYGRTLHRLLFVVLVWDEFTRVQAPDTSRILDIP
jgi:integrase